MNTFKKALNHIKELHILPELKQGLLQVVTSDANELLEGKIWPEIHSTLQYIFNQDKQKIDKFMVAWGLMYSSTFLLDAIQDDDPLNKPLPFTQKPQQYNLAFSYFVLSSSLLDRLLEDEISGEKLAQLRVFWSDMILRVASGQQRDLNAYSDDTKENILDYYQNLAQAKTGSVFALAFGGAAILFNSNTNSISDFALIGEIFGTLLQYADDILDSQSQNNITITLPIALMSMKELSKTQNTTHTPESFWSYLYNPYKSYLQNHLHRFEKPVQDAVLSLFFRIFEQSRTI